GLVAIEADSADRRGCLLSLTGKGRKVLASAVPIWREVHAGIEAGLPGVDPDELRGALKALC
ncbi:MAG: winged helix-turn-helix transcriptional regulator, partial [Acetobacteraceae bacterium]|nr:winged helix-turn-helix transcriptional regulator [Acetobacteraceae bacterium]